jgi:hypothetical protein
LVSILVWTFFHLKIPDSNTISCRHRQTGLLLLAETGRAKIVQNGARPSIWVTKTGHTAGQHWWEVFSFQSFQYSIFKMLLVKMDGLSDFRPFVKMAFRHLPRNNNKKEKI